MRGGTLILIKVTVLGIVLNQFLLCKIWQYGRY